MTPHLRVEPERGRADRRAFLGLPYRLYAGHTHWVPPLRMAEAALMNRRKNPFFQHAEVEHFLARRGRRVVGRIAAIQNSRHNEIHEDRLGFFGFFDAEPDAEATSALVEAARVWVTARGLAPMRGPVNYSTNDSCGVLVDGFDESPFVMMPYNRPDYDALLRGAGLVAVKDLLAYWISSRDSQQERFERIVTRRLARSAVRLRDLDLSNFDSELVIMRDLYNRSWEKNWGFVPATRAEFDHAAKDLRLLVAPTVSAIAERDGVPVAFSAFIRDVNVLLKGTRGRLFPTLWWRLLRRIGKVDQVRCILLGIVPEARGIAINEAFFLHALKRGALIGLRGAEAGWVLEDNKGVRAPIEASGAKITKRYRLYETPSAS